ncbi:hypothetical protein C8J30_12321 [Rhodobacter viridis]|uniref:Subtilase family protein n=1 Tax=Rhodobacter viridis TaxID=1054202 RepID=A0A318TPN0_9RHOB|nr:S8 family serine peptidase [Rhodobacter viridis]PYF06766.1 hypothetical protein C8J30_12321 [Rhodobacter viridis]
MATGTSVLAGYAVWESRTGASDTAWCPVALTCELKAAQVRQRLGARDSVVVPGCERARLVLEEGKADALAQLQGTDLLVFVRQDALGAVVPELLNDLTAKLLSIGAPFAAPAGFDTPPALAEPDRVIDDKQGAGPLVGIIDDGIAWANRRFCRLDGGVTKTRFTAVWLQSEAVLSKTAAAGLGHVLTAGAIDAHLDSGRAEADLYRDLNRVLYPPPAQAATNTAVAHGTHVLDLAAGEDPATGGGPLIAVQLPATMMADTSGRKMELFLVLGLRWIVTQAVGLGRDLVVNLSLGSLAGPGDETHVIAHAIKHEIGRFTALTGKRMRVVVAYGNSWRDNLVGEMALDDGWPTTRSVDWRILPDDYSSSFLELRIPKKRSGDLTLTLSAPGGAAQTLTWPNGPQPGAPLWLGTQTAAILPLPDEEDCHALLLAVAPTAGEGALAPAGAWRLTVALREGAAPCTVTLRVQRTDTPAGYRVFGRQSYLADAKTGDWDADTRDYTCPSGDSVIRRAGTANAYAGAADIRELGGASGVHYVAALRPDPLQKDGVRPSRYSSEGWTSLGNQPSNLHIHSVGPTCAIQADDSMFLQGLRGTGVLSGARTLRLSGTSVAAGAATREIVKELAQSRQPGAGPGRVPPGAPFKVSRDSRTGAPLAPPSRSILA